MRLLLTGVTGAGTYPFALNSCNYIYQYPSGLAGIQIYRTAILDESISKITVLTRRPLPSWMDLPPAAASKTDVIILKDFLKYPADISARLAEHDACIWALGASSAGMKEAEYTKVTYGFTMAAVKALEEGGVAKRRELGGGDPFQFVLVSGEGANHTEKSIMMFARVKGRTEKALLELPPSAGIKASAIRPGYFFSSPLDSEHIRGLGSRVVNCIYSPIYSTLMPSRYTTVEGMGKVAVALAKGQRRDERTVSSRRINEMAKEL